MVMGPVCAASGEIEVGTATFGQDGGITVVYLSQSLDLIDNSMHASADHDAGLDCEQFPLTEDVSANTDALSQTTRRVVAQVRAAKSLPENTPVNIYDLAKED